MSCSASGMQLKDVRCAGGSRRIVMATDYMFIVLSCSVLVADRLDGSSHETKTRHTVSRYIILRDTNDRLRFVVLTGNM